VLVVHADGLQSGLPQHVVAMISSNLGRVGHASRVTISLATPAGQRTGLKTDSVIMTDNLATIFDHEFDRVIGQLSDMAAVDTALRHTFGL
jgi:mRNA interferase MazF